MSEEDIEALNEQIKSCPCCGAQANPQWVFEDMVGIYCYGCNLLIRDKPERDSQAIKLTPQEIVNRWNTRPTVKTNNSQSKIKPCPCCGGRAKLNPKGAVSSLDNMLCAELYMINCTRCHIEYIHELEAENGHQLVIDGWNRRVGD